METPTTEGHAHYEVPTLLSMACKIFYMIILMASCTGSLGGHIGPYVELQVVSIEVWSPYMRS